MAKESIGGLWIKTGRDGHKFMSGEINMFDRKLQIVIFKNDKGDNEKRPDYRIYLSEPRQDKPKQNPIDDGAPF